jgi:hypothetical protein
MFIALLLVMGLGKLTDQFACVYTCTARITSTDSDEFICGNMIFSALLPDIPNKLTHSSISDDEFNSVWDSLVFDNTRKC